MKGIGRGRATCGWWVGRRELRGMTCHRSQFQGCAGMEHGLLYDMAFSFSRFRLSREIGLVSDFPIHPS